MGCACGGGAIFLNTKSIVVVNISRLFSPSSVADYKPVGRDVPAERLYALAIFLNLVNYYPITAAGSEINIRFYIHPSRFNCF